MNNNKQEQEVFQWNDKLAKELCEYVGMRVGKNRDIRQQVELLTEDFKQSKVKKEEPPKESPLPITVDLFEQGYPHSSTVAKAGIARYDLYLSHPIPKEKYEPIKKAIQSVINNDGVSEYFNKQPKLYTESELLEAQQKAFYAAREGKPYGFNGEIFDNYPTFADYIQSLNK